LNTEEAAELIELEGILEDIKPKVEEEDKRRWIADTTGNFTVSSCY
jgi:hypothetical protein